MPIFNRFCMGSSVEVALTIWSNDFALLNKMAALPKFGKTLENLLLQIQEIFEAESWYIESGTQSLPSMLILGWSSTLYGTVKFLSLLLWQYWKKVAWHPQICNGFLTRVSESRFISPKKGNWFYSVAGWPCGSVAQLARVLAWSARGPGFEFRSGHVLFFSPVTFGGSVWVRARAASSKGTVSSVPARFRADSGTNLFKQGEIVAGRPCG